VSNGQQNPDHSKATATSASNLARWPILASRSTCPDGRMNERQRSQSKCWRYRESSPGESVPSISLDKMQKCRWCPNQAGTFDSTFGRFFFNIRSNQVKSFRTPHLCAPPKHLKNARPPRAPSVVYGNFQRSQYPSTQDLSADASQSVPPSMTMLTLA